MKYIGVLSRIAKLLTLITLITFSATSFAKEFAVGQILLKTKANVPPAKLAALLHNNNASIISTINGIEVHIVKVPAHTEETLVQALSHNPDIEFAELDTLQQLQSTIPNDTYYSSEWHLTKINAPGAWDMSKGSNVTVAVLDTGVDNTHPDLSANVLPGINIVDNTTNTTDTVGHGTEVAGVIGAIGNNGFGVAGTAWNVKILPVRVSNLSDGSAYTSDLANAIVWAADHGANIANASYALAGSSTIDSSASYLKSKGGLMTVSAGNDGNYYSIPNSKNIIAVTATDSSDTKTSWSTYGDFVDVAAPGLYIWTTASGGGYASVSGTSFSAPLTAGVLALMKSANPNLTPDQLENILEANAVDLGTTGWDTQYGYGRIDAYKAVLAAVNAGGTGGTTDTTPPTVSLTTPGGTVSGTVTISATASDNVQLTSLTIYAGSTQLGTTSTGTLNINWDTTQFADGSVTLKAVAVDSANNTSSATSTVTVANNVASDTTPPTMNIVGISDGQTISSNTNVSINASDNVALYSVNCKVDNVLVASGNTSLSITLNVRKLVLGGHTLLAEATDTAGNKTSVTINFSVVTSTKGGGGGNGHKK